MFYLVTYRIGLFRSIALRNRQEFQASYLSTFSIGR